MNSRSSTLLVRAAGSRTREAWSRGERRPRRARYRVDADGAALGLAELDEDTPFDLTPGTHRIQVRLDLPFPVRPIVPLRSDALDVDFPAGGRVELGVRVTPAVAAVVIPPALFVITGSLWAMTSMVPLFVLLFCVPGTLFRLRAAAL
ncbi:hypothetical protein [Kitasatospora sp. NPDC004531]